MRGYVRQVYKVAPDPVLDMSGDGAPPDPATELETFEVEVDRLRAKRLKDELLDAMGDARRDHPDCDAVALDVKRYAELDAFMRNENGVTLDDAWGFEVHAIDTPARVMEPLYSNSAKMGDHFL